MKMNILDLKVVGKFGETIDLRDYENKVMLIINTATMCGFTPQYDALQDMYEKYENDGFVILDFPCNQFGNQAPGTNQEIATFCDSKYGITFPVFSKIDVNGDSAIPLYRYLVSEKGFAGFDPEHELSSVLDNMLSQSNPNYKNEPDIKWNFTKFLVDRKGNVVERFEPTADMEVIEERVKEILDDKHNL
jgi:glutathione peroxidase